MDFADVRILAEVERKWIFNIRKIVMAKSAEFNIRKIYLWTLRM